MHLVYYQKYLQSLSISTQYQTPKFKIFSKSHDILLTLSPVNSKYKSRSLTPIIQWNKIYNANPRVRKGSKVRRYRTKTSRANSAFCISTPNVKVLLQLHLLPVLLCDRATVPP